MSDIAEKNALTRGIVTFIWLKEGYSTWNKAFTSLPLPGVGVATFYQFMVLAPVALASLIFIMSNNFTTTAMLQAMPFNAAAFVFAFLRNKTFVLPLIVYFKVVRLVRDYRRVKKNRQRQNVRV